MITKIGSTLLIAAVALFVAAPMSAFAQTPAQKKKIKKLEADLKKLKNRASPASKVRSLVTKLAKLNPIKGASYYSTGLSKLALTLPNKNVANSIAKTVTTTVKKSSLKKAQINKIVKAVGNAQKRFSPTPVSPTSMLDMNQSLVFA